MDNNIKTVHDIIIHKKINRKTLQLIFFIYSTGTITLFTLWISIGNKLEYVCSILSYKFPLYPLASIVTATKYLIFSCSYPFLPIACNVKNGFNNDVALIDLVFFITVSHFKSLFLSAFSLLSFFCSTTYR